MVDRAAICIGVDSYQDYPEDQLDFCVADASLVADYLELPEYSFNVTRIFDEEATRYGILSSLYAVLRDPPRFFILYYAGHGLVSEFGSSLVTHDAREFEPGISVSEVGSIVQRISDVVPHCLVVLDCCHSGSFTLDKTLRSIASSDIERGIVTRSESRTLLAACRPEQAAEEDPNIGHGIFTYALIQGLDGEAADARGDITVGGLAELIARKLEEQGCEQIMVSRGDSAGRVVLATGLPPVSREKLPSETRKAILGEGRQYIDDYASHLNASLEDWKLRGHRAASQILAPTARWFEGKRQSHRDLATDPEFISLYEAVTNRVKQLAEVDRGTVMAEGVISERLGGGGFGTVWKVVPEDVGRPELAYKIYHPADYGVLEKRGLFQRGYRAMQQLDHPRVVKVHGYTDCPVGFFMDCINGPSLRDLPTIIEDPAELLRLLNLIGETISHAHSRGVVHRDIKPENILATYVPEDNSWLPFLTDFDLSWFSQATQVTKQAWGNLSYAAPEQLANPRSNVARAKAVDVYAFGQVAYFAVTGSDPTPVRREENAKVLRQRLERWTIAEAAESFLNWYQKCTADLPDRYTSFLDVMDDLYAVESILRNADEEQLDMERLTREIAFSLSGFASLHMKSLGEFSSTSGRTRIKIKCEPSPSNEKIPRVNVEAELRLHEIPLEAGSNERGRSILNHRITDILTQFSGVKRIPGSQGIFATTIHISNVTLDRAGVEYARMIYRRVLDAIER